MVVTAPFEIVLFEILVVTFFTVLDAQIYLSFPIFDLDNPLLILINFNFHHFVASAKISVFFFAFVQLFLQVDDVIF